MKLTEKQKAERKRYNERQWFWFKFIMKDRTWALIGYWTTAFIICVCFYVYFWLTDNL